MELKRIAVDTSKHCFTLHGVDAADRVVLRRDLRQGQVEAFFAKLEPTEVVLEACGGSHHWRRRLGALGHRVKPFVKRGKSDRADAEAIGEAAARPSMGFVPVKSAEAQAALMVLRTRELLVRQRTQLVNALRGHAAEFGLVAAKGLSKVETLLAAVAAEPAVPLLAREMIALLGRQIALVEQQVREVEARLLALHEANPVSRLLAGIPGVGPITAISLALGIDAGQFA